MMHSSANDRMFDIYFFVEELVEVLVWVWVWLGLARCVTEEFCDSVGKGHGGTVVELVVLGSLFGVFYV